MISHWEDALPTAIQDLQPIHRELVEYILTLPGKKRPTYIHARRTWNLNKDQFNYELQSAFSSLRDSLKRLGVHKFSDLDMA
jgi:hypothetical protein